MDCWIKLIGVWILSDAFYSLLLYVGKPEEKWLKHHSIRIVRAILAVLLILYG